MIISSYFNDLIPVYPGIYRNFCGHIKSFKPSRYSIELMASGTMYFEEEPGPRHVFRNPCLRWQHPDRTYHYGPLNDEGWEHLFITFEGARAEHLYRNGFCALTEECFIPIQRVELFRSLFTSIHHAVLHKNVLSAHAITMIEQILLHAIEEVNGLSSPGRYSPLLDQICEAINLNPEQAFSLPKLAEDNKISYSHFRKCFTEHTGIAPYEYIMQARLRAAIERLRFTNDPIKQIAYELHLGNPSQFSKTFKNHYGMTPKACRAGMPGVHSIIVT